jgi:hypothetical protein
MRVYIYNVDTRKASGGWDTLAEALKQPAEPKTVLHDDGEGVLARPGASGWRLTRDGAKLLLRNFPLVEQRQDALNSQLEDLRNIANRLGMYDAADFLTRALPREERDDEHDDNDYHHDLKKEGG